ncbi:hypothetical protein AB664_26170 [Brucella anthropi]|uniref:Apiosidase-like catalytic domain-containing protein n=1 Tax=Brucella anthropi TaxID=529 RepID=A0A656Z610_BRUAN|nr:hypothetical protein AB664_26170 [Brucella anthropi]
MRIARSGLMIILLLVLTAAKLPSIFPVAVSGDQRLLENADGRPFLLLGDAAWSLIAELGRQDTETYLDDRAKRGFNASWLILSNTSFQATRRPMPLATGRFRSSRLQRWERIILIMRHGSLIRHQEEACLCFSSRPILA